MYSNHRIIIIHSYHIKDIHHQTQVKIHKILNHLINKFINLNHLLNFPVLIIQSMKHNKTSIHIININNNLITLNKNFKKNYLKLAMKMGILHMIVRFLICF